MKHYIFVFLAVLCFLFGLVMPALAKNDISGLSAKAQSQSKVRVIVQLNETVESGAGVAGLNGISAVQSSLASTFSSVSYVDHISGTDLTVMEVDAAQLDQLSKSNLVVNIYEDKLNKPMLAQSLPVIHATQAHSNGITGSGTVIAILDTGVDTTHAAMTGKIVAEACFSTNGFSGLYTSFCPGAAATSSASGSGDDCSGVGGCGHGTHVAGIAAGNGGGVTGVAPDADIIAIQVFTRVNSELFCGVGSSPCARSFDSDLIRALEHVKTLAATHNIVSVNMSLGGGNHSSACDDDPLKPSIDDLRAMNIGTVIASGNDGFSGSISSPACVSSAIAVGATNNSDVLRAFSNTSDLVDLLAPGTSITSARNGGGTVSLSGTSMATPHVAGAWALHRSVHPTDSVAEVLNRMEATGVDITVTRTDPDIVIPRLDVEYLYTSDSLPAMDNATFIGALRSTNFYDNCVNTTTQSAVALDGSSSSSCVYSTSSINYGHISQWNTASVTSMAGAFTNAANFNQDIRLWDVSNVTTSLSMFRNATAFNKDISNWFGEDNSSLQNMTSMFYGASAFNQDIGDWDVSNVVTTTFAFADATKFNQDIGDWDVSNVTGMSGMFHTANDFNGAIANWDVSGVTDMQFMFFNAKNFNQDIRVWDVASPTVVSDMFTGADAMETAFGDVEGFDDTPDYTFFDQIGLSRNVMDSAIFSAALHAVSSTCLSVANQSSVAIDGSSPSSCVYSDGGTNYGHISFWNTASVTDMSGAFQNFQPFNQDISRWDVSSVTDMSEMFRSARDFDQDIGGWDTSNVTTTKAMFRDARTFNQDLNNWVVSSVTDMSEMFYNVQNFNGDIGGWNTSNVTTMNLMFQFALSFNQDISRWNVGSVTDMDYMFAATDNFNQDIGGWNVSSVTSTESMFRVSVFNQNISSWDMSNVIDMRQMFESAEFFDQDIRDWNTGSVSSSYYAGMFDGATAMQNRFGTSGLNVSGFGATPTVAFFNQGSVSALDGITAVSKEFPSLVTSSVVLTPTFSSEIRNYSGSSSRVRFLEIALDLARPNSTLSMIHETDTGTTSRSAGSIDVDGKVSFDFIPVSSGSNVFDILITSPDESTSTLYILTIEGTEPSIVMDNNIFNNALSNTSFITACLDEDDQASVSLTGTASSACVYSNGGINYGHISNWDVSGVTIMDAAFDSRDKFDQDISGWDVSSVTSTEGMFSQASKFNQDISGWTFTSLVNSSVMFNQADAFNRDISSWDMSDVTNMSNMFLNNDGFDQDIRDWVVGETTILTTMFSGATKMIARFGDVPSFGSAANSYTPSHTFFNQGSVDSLDAITGVLSATSVTSTLGLSPVFASGTSEYNAIAVVGHVLDLTIDLSRYTATATASVTAGGDGPHNLAISAPSNPAGVATVASHTIVLGANVFDIVVTSRDGSASTTYRLTVTGTDKAVLSLGVSAPTSSEADGADVTFTVTQSETSSVTTSISYALTGSATLGVDYSGSNATGTLEVAAGATSTALALTVIDDLVYENDETIVMTISNSASDTISVASAVATHTILNNEFLGLIRQPTSPIIVAEGETATFTMALLSRPTADVTITATTTDRSEASFSTTSMTFTSSTWNVTNTVAITGLSDSLVDGDQSYFVELTFSSDDPFYSDLIALEPATTTDVDTGTLVLSTSSLSIAEGATATFTVALGVRPTEDVTVTISSADVDDEASFSTTSVVFTSSTWNVAQEITVRGVTDNLVDGDQGYSIDLSASSDLSGYEGVTSSLAATTTDVDEAKLSISTASPSLTEASTTVSFTVTQSAVATQSTIVVYSLGGTAVEGSDYTGAATGSVTIGAGATSSSFTVQLLDDNVADGNKTLIATLSSITNGMATIGSPASSNIVITDNETPGLDLSVSSLTVAEGATSSFTIALNTQPTANVTVSVTSGDSSEVSLSSGSVVFTSVDWNTPKTITVMGETDTLVDGTQAAQITLVGSSTDSNYHSSATGSVDVSVTDINVGTLVLSTSSLSIAEGSTATFTVKLGLRPLEDVTVTISSEDVDDEASFSTTSVVFTSSTWNVAQEITVTAANDNLVDGDQGYSIDLSASSDLSGYEGVTSSLAATTSDVSVGTIELSPSSLNVAEGATATFTVKLGLRPTQDVTVSVISSDSFEAILSTTSVVFTSSTWNTAQTITVTGVTDNLVDGDQGYSIDLSASSDLSGYDGVSRSLAATTTDVDEAKLSISTASPSLTEASTTVTFTVTQSTVATQSTIVVYSLGGTAVADSDYTGAATGSVTIGAGATSSSFTVQLLDDDVADGSKTLIATLSSITSGMATIGSPASSNIVITDNESPGFDLSVSSLTVAEGATSSFTIALNTQPTQDVTVSVTSGDSSEVGLSSGSVVFTSADWDTPKTIIVTGVTDTLVDGTQVAQITLVGSSTDSNYHSSATGSVDVSVTDMNVGTLVLSSSSLSIEEGATTTFTVKLGVRPTEDVTVTISSDDIDDEASFSTTSVVFTSANWNDPQTITVTAATDTLVDGDQGYSIDLSASSDLSGYDDVSSSIAATTSDVSVGTLVLSTSSLSVAEGATTTFTVKLGLRPTQDVTVSVISSDSSEATLSTTSVVFTSANWDDPQTITVTGVADNLVDGDQGYSIDLSASSGLSGYDDVTSSLAATTTDVDEAKLRISTASSSLTEASTTVTFTVTQSAVATQSTIVVYSLGGTVSAGSDYTGAATGSVTIGAGATSSSFTVQLLDDNVADGNKTLIATLSSITNGMATIGSPASSNIVITDNETPGLDLSGSSLTVAEGATSSFTIALNTQPTEDVTVSVTSGDSSEVGLSSGSVVFTSADWDTPKTIIVTGVTDTLVDGTQVAQITLVGSSTDSNYHSSATGNVDVSVTDVSVGSLVLSPSSLSIAEGATATFTVKLGVRPLEDVTVTISSGDVDDEASFSTTSVVFTSSTWNVAQEITVTAATDTLVDGDQGYSIDLSASSDLSGYEGVTSSLAATTSDVSVGSLVLSPSSLSIAEGSTATFTVKLGLRPTQDVTVSVISSDSSEASFSTTSVVFTSSTWNVAQEITVTAANDTLVDGDQGYSIDLSASSDLSGYEGVSRSLAATTSDVSVGSLVLSPSSLSIAEGATATFTVKLGLRPTQDVTVSVISSDSSEASFLPTSVVFTSSTWNVARTITVTAANDTLVDGDQGYSIDLSASSDLSGYEGVSRSLAATTTDVDEAKLSISTASPSVTEASTTVSFTVIQSAVATQSTIVVYSLGGTADEGSDYTGTATGSVTIGVGATSSSFTVQLLDDNVADGNKTLIATLSSITSGMATIGSPASSNIVITDNETPGFDLSDSSLTVAEGATSSFTIALNTQPTADVTVSVTSGDSSEVGLSSGSVVFTSVDWNTPKTIIVTGVADTLVDGTQVAQITLVGSSTDSNYHSSATGNVDVSVTDVSVGSLVLSPSSLNVAEGATATFTVKLGLRPTQDVTVSVISSDSSEASFSTTSVVFTSSTWNVAQEITVTAANDTLVDGDQGYSIDLSASSDLSGYDGVSRSLAATTSDVSVGTIELSTSSLSIAEGATATFTVALSVQPTQDVTVTISSSDVDDEASFLPTSVVFTSSTWNVAQEITVTAANDTLVDGDQGYSIDLSASSDLSGYEGVTSSLAATTSDVSLGSLVLSPSNLSIAEGATATFTVALSVQPTQDVTVTISSSDVDDEASFSPTSVVFTSSTWNTAQEITVTAANDTLVDGDQGYSIDLSASSDLSGYDGVSRSLAATTSDVSVGTIELSTSSLSVAEGSTATFTIALGVRPTQNVTVTIISEDIDDEASFLPTSVVFTSSTWNVARTITVTAANDNLVDGDQGYSIDLSASSDLSGYEGVSRSLAATTSDVDEAKLSISTASPSLTEASATVTFTVTQSAPATVDTQVEYQITGTASAGSDYIGTATGSVTIGAGATSSSFSRQILHDLVAEGDETLIVTLTSISAGVSSVSIGTPSSVTVTIRDNDDPGLSVSVSSLTLNEGASSSFTVVLDTQPEADVTVNLISSDSDASEGRLSTSSLIFTTGNWNRAQTVTLSAVEEDVADGDQSYTITLTGSSTDPNYHNVSSSIAAMTTDDDTAGTTLSTSRLSLAEGSSGSFTVVLTSEPTSDVTFTVNSSDVAGEASFSATSVVFTNANWDTVQTITVSATADNLVDGDQGYTITLTGSSADSNYDGVAMNISATTTDVDSATVSLSSGPASTTESTSTLLYTVTLSTASDATTTLSYTISGSMTAGADYEGSDAGSVSIAPRASTGTIAVTLIDDEDVEGPEQMTVRLGAITASVGSINLGTPLSVSTEVFDNDAGVVVLEDKVEVEEGETTTVSVKLSTQPDSDVTVTVSSTRLKEASSGPSSVLSFGARPFSSVELTFTPLNWNVPQEVEVTAEEDEDVVVDGDEEFEITLNAQSEDEEYEGVTSTVEAEVLDTDTAEIMTSVSSISVSEAGTTTFTVELTSRPSGTVTVSVVSGDTSEGTVSPASLTFPAADWNTPQTVTLTGSAADDIADGSKGYTLTLTAASADANFNGVATSVAATTLDTDASFISIAAPSSVSVSEATSTARLTIVQSVVSDQPTVIRYSLGGSATLGTDYTGPSVASGTVTIAAGATSTVFSITTSEDTAPEGDETIIFMLTSISSGVPSLGSPVQGIITIEDNDDIPSSEIEKDIESLIKAASEVLIATTPPVIAFIDAPSTGITVGGPQGGTSGSGFSGETTVNVKAKDGSLAARIVTDGFSLDVDSAKDKAAFSISRDGMRLGYSKDGARTQASFGTDQFALGYDTQNNRVQAGFSNGVVAAQYDRSDKRLKAGFTTQVLAVKVDESASKRTLSFDGRFTAVRSADERSGTLNGWVSGQFVRNTGENSQTDVFAGRVGMHHFISRDSLTGFVLTADSANGTFQRDGFDEDSKVSSRGYMLGIYHGSKVSLSGRALKLDLQGHFGSTNNTVTTPGGDTGSFSGSRAMLSGRASVDMLLSSGTTLSPYVQGHYLSQSTEKFTTTGGTEVDALSLSFVDLSAGARFGYRNAETDTRFGFEPSVVYRVNSSDEDDEKANQLRGKVSADVSVPLASGRLSSRVFYEGIGVENSTSYGGSIKYERNF